MELNHVVTVVDDNDYQHRDQKYIVLYSTKNNVTIHRRHQAQ